MIANPFLLNAPEEIEEFGRKVAENYTSTYSNLTYPQFYNEIKNITQ